MENPPKRMDDLEVPQPLRNLHEGLPSAGGPVGKVQQVVVRHGVFLMCQQGKCKHNQSTKMKIDGNRNCLQVSSSFCLVTT